MGWIEEEAEMDIDRAEILASIHAVLLGLQHAEAEIYTDSSYVRGIWCDTATGRRREANQDLLAIIRHIKKEIQHKGRKIKVCRVYSHITDGKDESERQRRRKWMESTYPGIADELINGNRIADILAKKREQREIVQTPHLPHCERHSLPSGGQRKDIRCEEVYEETETNRTHQSS